MRPFVWGLLFLPFGVSSGYVSVTIAFLAKAAHLSDTAIAALVASSLFPHAWKFLWAPVTDASWTRKRWYLAANVGTSGSILLLGFIPITEGTLPTLHLLVLGGAFATTFLGMAVEGLMANVATPDERGRASGWLQAGNVGGAGVGGGLALWLVEHVSPTVASVTVAALLAACTLALLVVPEDAKAPHAHGVLAELKAVLRELWTMVASRKGAFVLVLCFLPMGAGAAGGLFSAIAGTWGAGVDLVAVVNGLAGGGASAVGCLAGGVLSDRVDRRFAYAIAGALVAAAGAFLALAPKTPVFFTIGALLYLGATGVAYGAFTGFVLEAIGKGAGATKYNALASLSNVPITYMTLLNGYVSEKNGPTTMLLVEAAAGMTALALLAGAWFALGLHRKVVAPLPDPLPSGERETLR